MTIYIRLNGFDNTDINFGRPVTVFNLLTKRTRAVIAS